MKRTNFTVLAITTACIIPIIAPPLSAASGPKCFGVPATVVAAEDGAATFGTAGPDVIVGHSGADIIDGLGGDDLICGLDGVDVLIGGRGNDRIAGDAGDDELYGDMYSESGDVVGGGNDHPFGGDTRTTSLVTRRHSTGMPWVAVTTNSSVAPATTRI